MYNINTAINGFTIESVTENMIKVSKIIMGVKLVGTGETSIPNYIPIFKLVGSIDKSGMRINIYSIIFNENKKANYVSRKLLTGFDYNSKTIEEGLKAFDKMVKEIQHLSSNSLDSYSIEISGRTIIWERLSKGDIKVLTKIGDSIYEERVYRLNSIVKTKLDTVITVTYEDKYWVEEIVEF